VSGGWCRDGDAIVWALTVPAHARAEVHIPGLAVVEVGAGKHEWTTPTEAPPEEPTVTLWSPVADIVDSPRSYAAVMGVLDAHDTNLAEQVRRRTDWTLRTPLAAALFSVPPPVLDEIAAALDALARSQSHTR
jgi:alpha-L-rhamnosidase